MKITYGLMLAGAILAVSGSATAEEYNGRVHSVNHSDGSVQILRNDGARDYISVYASDRGQLNSLRNGSDVTFDATQRNGRWETSRFDSAPGSTDSSMGVNTAAGASSSGSTSGSPGTSGGSASTI